MLYFYIIPPIILYALFFYKFIRKYQYIHYAFVAIISIVFGATEGHNFVNNGFVGAAFFIVVMFTGSLSKSKLKKALMQVRAQYAIIGFIFISSHSIPYLLYVLDEGMVFVHLTIPIGIVIYLFFIPLSITSFSFVRKHMGYKLWKKFHNWAYLSYLLMFVHLYFISNSRSSFYLVLFIIYTVFRVIQYIDKHQTKKRLLNRE